MNRPCRGDCNQGRDCYCGAEGDEQYQMELLVIMVCVIVATWALVISVTLIAVT